MSRSTWLQTSLNILGETEWCYWTQVSSKYYSQSEIQCPHIHTSGLSEFDFCSLKILSLELLHFLFYFTNIFCLMIPYLIELTSILCLPCSDQAFGSKHSELLISLESQCHWTHLMLHSHSSVIYFSGAFWTVQILFELLLPGNGLFTVHTGSSCRLLVHILVTSCEYCTLSTVFASYHLMVKWELWKLRGKCVYYPIDWQSILLSYMLLWYYLFHCFHFKIL